MNTKYIHIGKSTILWEKTSFSRAFKFLKNNSLSRAELSDDNGNVKNIHYGDILIKFNECLYADEGNNIPYIINDNIAYKLLKLSPLINGDIVFADAAEDNTVGKCIEIITHNDTDLVAGLHTIPCRPTIKFAEGYLGYYLNSTAFHNQLLQYIQGTKISSISKKSICQTIISYPSEIINQQKIASYFQSLDSLIQTISKKLASLKRIKAASLQSMFPQEGETVPKVRFKGFEWEWKKVPFRSLVTFYRGLTYTPSNIRQKGTRVLRSSNINDGFLELSDNDVFVESTCVNVIYAKKGDILITSANGSPKLVGKHAIIDKQDNSPMVAGGFMLLAKSNESEFINISMNSSWYEKFLRTGISGGNGSIGNLNKTYLEDYVIHIPSTKTERDKLASFFTNLDKQIILQTQCLEKLKQIKAACLDKMFV